MARTIRQTVMFKVSPHEAYEALMDSRRHREVTGEKANISRKVGGRFTAYGGGISGENLTLEPDRKIVQSWRCTATGWPEDYYSRLAITLAAHEDDTQLSLNREEVPNEAYAECD